jgi:hypothetical protein
VLSYVEAKVLPEVFWTELGGVSLKTIAEIRAAGGKADFISSELRDASTARAVA